jgi:hypothetical protein
MVARPKSIESGKVACKTPVKNTLKKKTRRSKTIREQEKREIG